jgi:thiol-disulfide isomerase/thioredoxin
MLNKRHLLTGFALAITMMVSAPLDAMSRKPFDAKAFEAAQAAGQPILIEVSAPWCPICKAQKPILSNLAAKPKFKDVTLFEIDFDSQKDLLRTFNVRMQSTLIAFKGKQEKARSTGDTNASSIERLLDQTL